MNHDEVEKALADVDRYGHLEYPKGEDRAALNQAAKVLAPAVRELRAELADTHKYAKRLSDEADSFRIIALARVRVLQSLLGDVREGFDRVNGNNGWSQDEVRAWCEAVDKALGGER